MALPVTVTISWAANFANWVYGRVVANQLLGVVTAAVPLNFQKSVFQAQLESCVITTSSLAGATQFANAWEAAIMASATLMVSSGDYVGSSGPGTTWGSVDSKIIDPASISAGKAIIISLGSEGPVSLSSDSKFPEKFRNAFLALTGTISGKDSVPPPGGPNTLVASSIPII